MSLTRHRHIPTFTERRMKILNQIESQNNSEGIAYRTEPKLSNEVWIKFQELTGFKFNTSEKNGNLIVPEKTLEHTQIETLEELLSHAYSVIEESNNK